MDSNHRPPACQAGALTSELRAYIFENTGVRRTVSITTGKKGSQREGGRDKGHLVSRRVGDLVIQSPAHQSAKLPTHQTKPPTTKLLADDPCRLRQEIVVLNVVQILGQRRLRIERQQKALPRRDYRSLSAAARSRSRDCRNALRWTNGDHRLPAGRPWFSGTECTGRTFASIVVLRRPRGAPNPCKSRAAPGPRADESLRCHCHPHRSSARSSDKSGRSPDCPGTAALNAGGLIVGIPVL